SIRRSSTRGRTRSSAGACSRTSRGSGTAATTSPTPPSAPSSGSRASSAARSSWRSSPRGRRRRASGSSTASTAASSACGARAHEPAPERRRAPLRRARRRRVPVVATTELAASFMANGYARATGRPGVVATIPGPGFAFALPGLAEARLDSAPLVHLAGAPARREDGGHALQAIPQAEIAGPLVKRVLTAETADGLATDVAEALAAAVAGEPGPVLLQVPEALLGERVRRRAAPVPRPPAPAAAPAPAQVETAAALLRRARRPLLLCGQGAAGAADGVAALARLLPAPVLTTTSGRGVVPETDPLALPFDAPGAPAAVVNALVAACDLVLALGV